MRIGDYALSVEVTGEHIEHVGVLIHYGIDHLDGVEHLVDGKKPEGVEVVKLFGSQGWHRRSRGVRWCSGIFEA